MKRIKDTFLETLQSRISFAEKSVLEIGCGDGSRTVQIASVCHEIIAIDPDETKIRLAQETHPLENGSYSVGAAEKLPFADRKFDFVIFTLSFHHVPIEKMTLAIDEAIRVLKEDGLVIFFEPAFRGTFFEAEIAFGACDGDERAKKAVAYAGMLSHPNLREVAELNDETIFEFDSYEDFVSSTDAKTGLSESLRSFLEKHEYLLRADRRINIFQPC